MDYWIRHQKKGVAVVQRDREAGKSTTLKHATLTLINKQYRAGDITRETAHKLAQEFIDTLRRPKVRAFNSENESLLEKYWDEVASLKDNRDPDAAFNRLKRGIEALGKVSIHVADKPALIKQLRDAPNRREATEVVNQLLKFLGRPFRLPSVREKRKAVVYLTWDQFKKVLAKVEDPRHRLLFIVLFCTGTRVGEAFRINRLVAPRVIFVEDQLLRTGQVDELKNGESGIRHVPILPQGVEVVKAWAEMPESEKLEIRNHRFGDILADACKAAGVGKISAKDLRHCYAIQLADRGASIGFIARALGNSEAVCNRYYAGYVLTEMGVEAVLNLLYENPKTKKEP